MFGFFYCNRKLKLLKQKQYLLVQKYANYFEMSMQTNTGVSIPNICGGNNGQHIYIDIGREPTDKVTVNFAFSTSSTSRKWDIKVSQIPCYVNYA